MTYFVLSPFVALCAGAVLQCRVFGGALGLAIASAVMNNYATSNLRHLVSPEQLATILRSTAEISRFPDPLRTDVLKVLLDSYNRRMNTLSGITAVEVFVIAMLWRKPQIQIPKKARGQPAVAPKDVEAAKGSS